MTASIELATATRALFGPRRFARRSGHGDEPRLLAWLGRRTPWTRSTPTGSVPARTTSRPSPSIVGEGDQRVFGWTPSRSPRTGAGAMNRTAVAVLLRHV